MRILESRSEEESFRIAEELGKKAKAGEIYCLEGELGVGKTVFAKGFAKGLGIDAVIDSPTFNIVKEYQGRFVLYHFDVYRIEDIDELLEIGFEEMTGNGATRYVLLSGQVGLRKKSLLLPSGYALIKIWIKASSIGK